MLDLCVLQLTSSSCANVLYCLLTSRVCPLDLLDLLPDPLLDLLPLLVIAVGDLVDLLPNSPLPAFDRLRWYRAYVVSNSVAVAVAAIPLIISEQRMVLDFIVDSCIDIIWFVVKWCRGEVYRWRLIAK